MARDAKGQGKGVIELLEEAVHLLRASGGGSLAAYYVGSLPFVLGLLYFWADMSRSPFAAGRLTAAALGMTVLFLWAKCWQAVFARGLLARLCGEPAPRWTPGRLCRLALTQAAVQPWGLFVLPAAAAMLLLPLPWAYAFFQNASVLGDGGREGGAGRTARAALGQAGLWPGENFRVGAILMLLGLFVFVNLSHAFLLVPWMLKWLLDVETVFSRGGFNPLNTTFLAMMAGLTYLVMDPVVKAFYALRCFYGRSLRTGQDLLAELKRASGAGRRLAAACAAAVVLALPAAARADAPPAADAAPAARRPVRPERLDESIERVIHRREYAWRMPRRRTPEAEEADGPLASLGRTLREWMEGLTEWLDRGGGGSGGGGPGGRGGGGPGGGEIDLGGGGGHSWLGALRFFVYLLLGLALAALVVLLAREIARRRRAEPVEAEADDDAVAAAPDLEDESVTAEDLPEDGWLDMAREMLQRGQRRLAVRAMFLAALALLAEHRLIAIARGKSNRDYHRELARRGHALGDLVESFGQNVTVFEDSWYGMHEVTDRTVRRFIENQRRIKGLVVA